MGRLGVVALDGMKIAGNTSKAANRTEGKLAEPARETVAVHAAADAAEDELFGTGRPLNECHNPVMGLPAPIRFLCRLARGNRQQCHEADPGLAERSEEILISELGR